jgi:hypothetical protein
MKRECANTHKYTYNTIYEIQVKVIIDKCHELGFTKDKAPKCASKDNQSFCGSIHLSHDRHTLFALEESEPPRMSYPVPRNRERSLHTCAQDVQITRMATI